MTGRAVSRTHSKQLKSAAVGMGEQPALLVVDASLGFTDPQSPLGADFGPEIAVIARLLTHAHSQGWPCFLSTVVYRSPDQAAVFRRKIPDLNMLEPNSPMVRIDPRLPVGEQDRVIEKLHASCFHGTNLTERLRDAGVDTLIVTGFTTSGCVRASAVDALQEGFRVLVVSDAVGDRDPDAHRANLKDLGLKYADLCESADLLSA